MAEVNKIEVNGETLMDLTKDTVTENTLDEGVTAHDAAGRSITGKRSTANVQYIPQELTAEQKTQARENIGAQNGVFRPNVSQAGDLTWDFIDTSEPFFYPIETNIKGPAGPTGPRGSNGWVYFPVIDEEGNYGWDVFQPGSNSVGLPDIIPTVNLVEMAVDALGDHVLIAETPGALDQVAVSDGAGGIKWVDRDEFGTPELDDPNLEVRESNLRHVVQFGVWRDESGNIIGISTTDEVNFAAIRDKFAETAEVYAKAGNNYLPLTELTNDRAVFSATYERGGLLWNATFTVPASGSKTYTEGEFSKEGQPGKDGKDGEPGPAGPPGPPYELTDEDKAEIVEAVRAADQAEPVPWARVAEKPFHTVKSNTLTWDGDLTGKEQTFESLYVKLSDVVLTEEDLSGGGRVVLSGWPDDAPSWVGITSDVTEWSDLSGINFIPDVGGTILPPGGGYAGLPIVMVIFQDYTLEDGAQTYLLTPGIYVFRVGLFYEGAHVSQFTVNNFNGFEREVIKKSALPDDVTLRTDETLRYENGVLGVNTALDAEQDNTLPITSAAVYETLGNIELLLGTI